MSSVEMLNYLDDFKAEVDKEQAWTPELRTTFNLQYLIHEELAYQESVKK